jgi:hypothetical protein
MPRPLTPQEEERFMGWARELESLLPMLWKASIPEQVQAYKQLQKRILKETRTAFEKQEMRRRITETLLLVTSSGPWIGFSPYLRRMERLGYSSMDCRLLVCCWAAQATKGSTAGRRKTAELIAGFERRALGRKVYPELRQQIDHMLTRARRFAGLEPGPDTAQGRNRRKRTKA